MPLIISFMLLKKTTFSLYKDLYNTDCANWDDFMKVCLRFSKLGMAEYTKFGNYILPKKYSD